MLSFNRRAAFNRSTSTFFSGNVNLSITSEVAALIAVSTFNGNAKLKLSAENKSMNVLNSFSGSANFTLFASGVMNKSVSFTGNAQLSLYASGSIIRLRNLATPQNRAIANLFIFSAGAMSTSSSFLGNANLAIYSLAKLTAIKSFEGESNLSLFASGTINVIRGFRGSANLELYTTSEGFNTFRLEYISLPNLILKKGDELVINIENKTITLNGQNAMRYLTRESDFFLFNPSENTIEFKNDTKGGETDIRILWKDAWL